jgi:hypothetical protein
MRLGGETRVLASPSSIGPDMGSLVRSLSARRSFDPVTVRRRGAAFRLEPERRSCLRSSRQGRGSGRHGRERLCGRSPATLFARSRRLAGRRRHGGSVWIERHRREDGGRNDGRERCRKDEEEGDPESAQRLRRMHPRISCSSREHDPTVPIVPGPVNLFVRVPPDVRPAAPPQNVLPQSALSQSALDAWTLWIQSCSARVRRDSRGYPRAGEAGADDRSHPVRAPREGSLAQVERGARRRIQGRHRLAQRRGAHQGRRTTRACARPT